MPPVSSDIVNLKAGFPGVTFYTSIWGEGKNATFESRTKQVRRVFKANHFLGQSSNKRKFIRHSGREKKINYRRSEAHFFGPPPHERDIGILLWFSITKRGQAIQKCIGISFDAVLVYWISFFRLKKLSLKRFEKKVILSRWDGVLDSVTYTVQSSVWSD